MKEIQMNQSDITGIPQGSMWGKPVDPPIVGIITPTNTVPDSNWSVLPVRYDKTFYVASRTHHAEHWKELAKDFPIKASWIYEAGVGETKSMAELWARIEAEIKSSFALFLYLEFGDSPLKGAFVEVGMALAAGKRVYLLTKNLDDWQFQRIVGSWVHHPLVTRLDSKLSLKDAAALIKPVVLLK